MVGRVDEPGPDARVLGRMLERLANDGTLSAWIEDDREVYALAEQLLRMLRELESSRSPAGTPSADGEQGGDGVVGPSA